MSKYIICGILAIVIAILIWWLASIFIVLIYPEIKQYNHGRCRSCGTKLKFKDYKENKSYGTCHCPRCGRVVYIYYIGRFIARKHRKNKRG